MFFCDRSLWWWANSTGIVLEIVGALVIVYSAFRARAKIKDEVDSWQAELPSQLRDIVAAQAYTELWGFVLLALGLGGQLLSTFE